MRRGRTTTWSVGSLLLGPLVFACSSETFSSGNDDGGGATAASNGGIPNTGGVSTWSGHPGAGGVSESGGISSNGGRRPVAGGGGAGATPAGGSAGTVTAGSAGTRVDSGVPDATVGPPDAGAVSCFGDPPRCPTFVKACSNDTDCTLVGHEISCCGSELLMAINHAAAAAFDAAEAFWDRQYPACGCQPQIPVAEDGTMIFPGSENLIIAACDNGACRSRFGGKTFACGTTSCPSVDYCVTELPGTGGAPTYHCMPLQYCSTCDCLGGLGNQGCQCSSGPVGITVTCAAP